MTDSIEKLVLKLRERRWVGATVVLLLAVLSAQVIHTIRGESLTWDEDDHIFAGYQSWKTHDYGLNPEHPPMVKLLAALPLLGLDLKVPPLQARFFKTEAYMDGREMLFRNADRYSAESLVFRARLPTLLFALAAALLVFCAARAMFGVPAGLIALTLFCFEPTALAHSALVTTDMAASATILATIYCFWRWSERPTWPRLLAIGAAAGLALAAKHSGVLVAPMLVLLMLLLLWREAARQRSVGRPMTARDMLRAALSLAGMFAVITLVGVLVLWSFYGFRYAARPPGLALSPSLQEYVGPLAGFEGRGILFAARFHLLPESWLYGLADVRAMANGMPSFFLGHVYAHGVWFYFPVLFTIKATLGMLALLLLTAFAAARGWLQQRWALICILTPAALYMLVAMGSHLNIGARHILPVFVFSCVLCGAGAATLFKRGARWRWAVAVLLALHVGSSLRAFNTHMAYANEMWGGPSATHIYLSDSNTDWGQQLIAVSAYLRERHIEHCWFAYFVEPFVRAADYGIPCRMLPTADTMSLTGQDLTVYDVPTVIGGKLDGPVLISAGDLNGFELGSSVLNPYESFRARTPVDFIQDGVFVYQGRFGVPLASALGHVQRSGVLLKAGDAAGALHEAELAEQTAPDEVQPELALGDALAAVGRKDEAHAAYERARTRIAAMDADAQQSWLAKLDAGEAELR